MFIDEWVGDAAYKQLPLGYHSHSNFCCGQFFWTHIQYAYENLELWRPLVDADEPTRTIATNFRIAPAGRDAFKRSLPLADPKLETNEEFVVGRAKKRPVMLIQPEAADMAVNNVGYRGKIQLRDLS